MVAGSCHRAAAEDELLLGESAVEAAEESREQGISLPQGPCRSGRAVGFVTAWRLAAVVAVAACLVLFGAAVYPRSCMWRSCRQEEDATSPAQLKLVRQFLSDSKSSKEQRAQQPKEPPRCFSGYQTVPEYLACLASIPIEAKRRDCVIDIVFNQLRSLYTYSDLLKDSLKHDAELANGFNFQVYNISLGNVLHDTMQRLRSEKSGGLLALELSKLFYKFQDAHTQMYPNFLYRTRVMPPVSVAATMDESTGLMKFEVIGTLEGVSSELVGKVIDSINGQPALDYFLEVVSWAAIDKSRGAQLNRYLKRQRLSAMSLPAYDGAFNITLEDGSSHNLAWSVDLPRTACQLGTDYEICTKDEIMAGNCTNTTAFLEECFSYNQDFDDMAAMMDKLGYDLPCAAGSSTKVKDVARPRLSMTPMVGGHPLPRPQLPKEGPSQHMPVEELPGEPAHQGGHPTRSRAGAAPPQIEVVKSIGDVCYVLKVGLEGGASSAVLKITSFMQSKDILPCAQVAVDLAANVSDGDLIVDVIGNGGGYVSSGYELNHFLYSHLPNSPLKETFQACEWYDLPKNDALDWFVSLTWQQLPKLSAEPDPRQSILDLAHRMDIAVQSLSKSSNYFGRSDKADGLRNSSACLKTVISKFGTPEAPCRGSEAWTEFSALYKQCVALAKPLGGSQGMEIMSYSPSNKYPNQMAPPSWDYYTSTVTKLRGGTPRQFSSMTYLGSACMGYMAAYPEMYGEINLNTEAWPYQPQTKLKHIKYLSDGTCGSTCSVSSSTPYLEGLSTFVTFGGVKGEPMDISSFNGGNVGTYQSSGWSLWKEALDSFVDAGVFYPDSKPPTYPFLPIPLNLYKVRFAQRAEYPRPLGPKALPREWYLIPASHHLDVWTSYDLRHYDGLSPEAQSTLYELYSATAAKSPKPLARQ